MLPEDLRYAIKVSIIYVLLSFAFSLLALLHPLPLRPYINPEVVPRTTYYEPIFALAVSMWSFNLRFVLVGVGFATLLDVDHALLYAGLNVIGRPGHTPAFIMLSTLLMPFILVRRFDRRLSTITAASGIIHIAYDLLEGGNIFNFLFPLSPAETPLDTALWAPLSILAAALFASTRMGDRGRR